MEVAIKANMLWHAARMEVGPRLGAGRGGGLLPVFLRTKGKG